MLPKKVSEAVAEYCKQEKYFLSEEESTFNIIYLEGMNTDGSLNQDDPNEFNDLRCVFDNFLNCLAVWTATTEPGTQYTINPLNPYGAARIDFGQYQSWIVGQHKDHEALIQVKPVTVCRDLNKDFSRVGDKKETGLFGINQHWGYDLPKNNIQRASAGCLVGRTKDGHREFMALIKQDKRYKAWRSRYTFYTTIIPADKLAL